MDELPHLWRHEELPQRRLLQLPLLPPDVVRHQVLRGGSGGHHHAKTTLLQSGHRFGADLCLLGNLRLGRLRCLWSQAEVLHKPLICLRKRGFLAAATDLEVGGCWWLADVVWTGALVGVLVLGG